MKNNFFIHNFIPKGLSREMNESLYSWYLNSDIQEFKKEINSKESTFWMRKGEQKALKVFKLAAERVPAYSDFLSKNGVDPLKIKTFAQFQKNVPLIDKKNYITQYSLAEMSLDGKISSNTMTSFSSGTSGTQCFWPRSTFQDIEGAFMFEQFLTSVFEVDKKSTLIVSCFALGNYVAGTYVFSSLSYMVSKGYPVMIVTPGINQEDSLRMIKRLSPEFEQTIICGYPPLLRDLIHTGKASGFDWDSIHTKFLFSSELFSEAWREKVLEEAATKLLYRNSTNLYGTADATLFGLEHPIDLIVRKASAADPQFHEYFFGQDLTPTFVQYDPMLRFFESVNDEIVMTSLSGLPLVRYNLHDKGGVLSHEELVEKSLEKGVDVYQLLKNEQCEDTVFHFPHIFVFGRTDGSVSFYGLLLYPEYVKTGLETNGIENLVSGKFSVSVESDENLQPLLVIQVELAPGVKPEKEIEKMISTNILKKLRFRSAEYNRLVESLKTKAYPKVTLSEYGANELFKVQIKQRWVKRK